MFDISHHPFSVVISNISDYFKQMEEEEEEEEEKKEEEKRIIETPKKVLTPIETEKTAMDIIKSFNEKDKDPYTLINKFHELFTYSKDVLTPEQEERMISTAAQELSNATDSEGNKLFNDVQQAKDFLRLLKNPKLNTKYKLPTVLKRDLREKQPIIITPMTQRKIYKNPMMFNSFYEY